MSAAIPPLRFQDIAVESIRLPGTEGQQVRTDLLRLDRIHPLISGNKWFKLEPYLQQATSDGKKRIITYGGAWSNHLLATAAACNLRKLSSLGMVRGEKPKAPSPILKQAVELGMELRFLNRVDFSRQPLPSDYDGDRDAIIPAGGWGEPGAAGASAILNHCPAERYTHIVCAVGTGTMLAGLLRSTVAGQKIVGVPVLKGLRTLENDVRRLTPDPVACLQILSGYHGGGYARHTPALIAYMNDLWKGSGIPTDFVYTAKLCQAITDAIRKGIFTQSDRLLLIHSGGLSGNASLPQGTLRW